MEPMNLASRSYSLVPEIDDGLHFRCTECAREIHSGYPFVPVRRDITRPDRSHDGEPVMDALCVYCDQFPV